MRDIDNNLRRITATDDLSYAPAVTEDEGPNSADNFKVALSKKVIDPETLSRLIEECREDEEKFSIMQEMKDD